MEDADGDGTFRTGKKWSGIWTRDISHATVLSLAWMEDKGYYGQ